MKREILFRGKRVDNGEWTEGYFCECPCDDGTDIPSIMRIESKGNHRTLMQYPVIAETLGQFTGLTDKNGVRIFEGDVVKTKYGRVCKMIWLSSPRFQGFDFLPLEDRHQAPTAFDLYISENLEVIGNIHDGGAEI